jgi:hypothetical protein
MGHTQLDRPAARDQMGARARLGSRRETNDPSKEGVFAMRLKAAKGYHIPPHTHPKPEINTVISGSKAQQLPVDSFFALTRSMAHYIFFDEDTVVQINTSGPWGRMIRDRSRNNAHILALAAR